MALDVYVGGFGRYFSRNWENVAQKWARETGTQYQQIGPDGPPQPADWEQVSEAVKHWTTAMNRGLGENLPAPLTWDESADAPYFTDRPGYEGYGALLVWAAHAEQGTPPPEEFDGEWFTDEAFLEASEPKQGQKFRPLIGSTLWLPGSFEFSFGFKDLTGADVNICANTALLECLQELNQSTFAMSEDDLADALQGNFGEDANLETLAKYGLTLFHQLAEDSVRHHLPMVLSP